MPLINKGEEFRATVVKFRQKRCFCAGYNQDGEFENEILSRDQLMAVWDKGWNCLFSVLNVLT